MARDSLVREGTHAIEDARASIKEIRSIVLTELAKRPDFWVARFESLAAERHLASNKDEHDRLVKEGEGSVARRDIDQLRELTFELSENMIRVGGSSHSDVIAGLMRG
jgi:molecular chaperone DnaK